MGTGTRKLLVVEDDPGLQNQLRWAFDGYEVMTVGDRQAALEQIRSYQPPVVTLDWDCHPMQTAPAKASPPCRKSCGPHPTQGDCRDRQCRSRKRPAGREHGRLRLLQQAHQRRLLSFLVNRAYRCMSWSRRIANSSNPYIARRLRALLPAARPCWKSARPLESGSIERHRTVARRKRHRQGTLRPGPARTQPARQETLCRD